MDGCVRPLWLRQERSHKHEGDRQLRLAVLPGWKDVRCVCVAKKSRILSKRHVCGRRELL